MARKARSAAGAEPDSSAGNWRRHLPAVGRLMTDRRLSGQIELYGREQVLVQVQAEIDRLRERPEGPLEGADPAEWVVAGVIERLASASTPALRRVLNATGIFLHTNLGRSPLPRQVVERQTGLLDAYCDLEFDLSTGRRGSRTGRVEELVCALTGAAGAVVVNNNAAAMVLILHTLARDREVIVSRGELVEIGGSFRVPSILEAAGAHLVEVGTTNRTRLEDYEQAISPRTAMLLKIHPSNYRIRGFVEEVSGTELATLAREHSLPAVMDEGSGLLRPSLHPQLAPHPSFSELVAGGVSLVCGSGDKLLGGPQAGLIAGDSELADRCRKNPLYRALRTDRATLAALEQVLRMHLRQEPLPIERLWADSGELEERLERVARRIGARLAPADAFVGGGAAPDAAIPGYALILGGGQELQTRLREAEPAVVGYMKDGWLHLDLRTVDPADDGALISAVREAGGGGEDSR
jgi:L-seryl-tRNA(Ser) seleniumtransferase